MEYFLKILLGQADLTKKKNEKFILYELLAHYGV